MLGAELEAPVLLPAWVIGIGKVQEGGRDTLPTLGHTPHTPKAPQAYSSHEDYLGLQILLLSTPTYSPYENCCQFIFHHPDESETPGGRPEYLEVGVEVGKESRGDGEAPRNISPSLQISPGSWGPPC